MTGAVGAGRSGEDTKSEVEFLVPPHWMGYGEWLEWSGLDDSFVGCALAGVPGTAELYDAAIQALEAEEPEFAP